MRSAPWFLIAVLASPALPAEEFGTTTGAFRVSLLSLRRQREVMLVQGPWVWVDEAGRQRPIDATTSRARASAGPLFRARLRLSTDPPTPFRLDGPPTLTDAVDDLDQTLEAAPEAEREGPRRANPARGAFTTVDVRLPLSLPEQPGKLIKRLRGTIPVVIPRRSDEPVAVVPLGDAKGRTFEVGDVKVTVIGVRIEPDRSARVSLSARLGTGKGDARGPSDGGRATARWLDLASHQLEVVDDQSRPIPAYPSAAVRRNEVRLTLRIMPGEPHGAPDRLRVFGLTTTAMQVPFDFKDVPMP